MKILPLFFTYLNIIYWIPIVYTSAVKSNAGKSEVKNLINFATNTNYSSIKIEDSTKNHEECPIINW